jgi:hypothetical protein
MNEGKIILSKVCHYHGVDALLSCLLKVNIHAPNSQEQGQTSGLPAGVCLPIASSRVLNGRQRGAGTIGRKSFVQMSTLGNRQPRAKPKSDYPSPVHSSHSPFPSPSVGSQAELLQTSRAYNCALILQS